MLATGSLRLRVAHLPSCRLSTRTRHTEQHGLSAPSQIDHGNLLREVWGFRSLGRTRTLDSHASRLRRKLACDGAGRFVLNVWGVGYRLLDG
jgi:Transcriptional regulatory protein, C terminal